MARKAKAGGGGLSCGPLGCCRVDAVVGVDGRGQMVLPKELRRKIGLRAGDRLALISWEREGQACCLLVVKADALVGMLGGLLGPLAKGGRP